MSNASGLYAAIDLGSNSFHMLVVREVAGSSQTLIRIKRKVRLAAGLDNNHCLSLVAMERGWQCLTLFSEHLQDIPNGQIRVVATATLRLANNRDAFLSTAEQILGCPIQVISGEEEARLIYQGVAHTTGGAQQRLVVDIGGASTELVTGQGMQATTLFSLSMGCVTWLDRYFADQQLTEQNFTDAQQSAEQLLAPVIAPLRENGWQICVGASGTIQALQSIMTAQGSDERITLEKLQQIRQQVIACGQMENLSITGLHTEQAAVFPSGLAILLAIFQTLHITQMTLAGGALREGLIYGMLQLPITQDIRQRTLHHLQRRYLLDREQARRVNQVAHHFVTQVATHWQWGEENLILLSSACMIYEIGLCIDFAQAPQHAAYLINHLALPGFTSAQKKFIAALLRNQSQTIELPLLQQQNAMPFIDAQRLCRLLRLAIIFASRRCDNALPQVTLHAEQEILQIALPADWLTQHPLRAEMLVQEVAHQQQAGWQLQLSGQ